MEMKFWLIINGLITNLWISTKLNIVTISGGGGGGGREVYFMDI